MKSCKNITILFFLLILCSCVNQKTKTNPSVIECENNITIFYPPNYNSANHSPSFAILNEPSLSKIKNDSNRKLKVEFAKLFNREVAQVTIDENVDLYGTGEVMGDLIRNGKTVKLWNTDLKKRHSFSWQMAPSFLGNRSGLKEVHLEKFALTLG